MTVVKTSKLIGLILLFVAITVLATRYQNASSKPHFVSDANHANLTEKIDANRKAIESLTRAVEKLDDRLQHAAASESSVDYQRFQKLLRSELNVLANQINSGQGPASGDLADASDEQSEINLEAFGAANDIVGAALRAGTWDQQDAADFREAFINLNNNQRNELMQELTAAIENNELSLDTPGYIF